MPEEKKPKKTEEPEEAEKAEESEPSDAAEAKDEPSKDEATADEAEANAEAEAKTEEAEPKADEVQGGDVAAKSAEDQPAAPKHPRDLPRGIGLALAIIFPTLFFLLVPPLSKSGLWDPFELNVADLARRLALNLFHAGGLALAGADNSLPHLNDLGRPELPFTSMALGFKLFGLHEWAGRFPLAIWGVAGVVATYGFVARLIDRRAGLFSAIALATMPLYFVQSRTMLGDIVTMACVGTSFGGLAVGAFDRTDKGAEVGAGRVAWTLLGLAALFGGFYSRGALLGVAVPALSVGVAWGLTWAAGRRARDGYGDLVGAAALLIGASALYWGVTAVTKGGPNLAIAAGAMIRTQPKYPTFDVIIGHLGHALAPWSAFVPFAFGRLFLAPVGRTGFVHQRESYTRMALLVGSAVAVAAHGWIDAKVDFIPFCAPVLLAAACGIALRDLDRGAHPSVAVGVGIALLLGVLHHDFHQMPEKAYQAFGIQQATFPESFKDTSLVLWTVALVSFALLAMLLWTEGDEEASEEEKLVFKPFDPDRYLHTLNRLREAWDGMLALAYFALVAGASLAGLAIWTGVRFKMPWVASVSLQVRDALLNAWWIAAFVPHVVIFGTIFALDAWRWAFDSARPFSSASFTRGFEPFEELVDRLKKGPGEDEASEQRQRWVMSAAVLFPLMMLAVPGGLIGYLVTHGTRWPIAVAFGIPAGIAAFLLLGFLGDLLGGSRTAGFSVLAAVPGFVLCFGYYPALANQLSPKEVFESYQHVHKGAEPLALLGVGGRTAAYYAGGQVETLQNTQAGFQWLLEAEPGHRRYLATRAEELPKLNQLYRQHTHAQGEPAQNLPILDARSSQILLAASSLLPGEKNQNPFGKILLSAPPTPQHKLTVNMEDRLEVLGYDMIDTRGRLVDVVAPGRKYRMRTYYKVLAPVTTEWEAFIHIDGYRRRHNGDHKPLEGKYPFALWQKDDLIVDDYEFSLEPNFSPGVYTVFFGLFVGETRMKVLSGPNDHDNRIDGGPLRVQ
jgi:4-amino-4-deoxy-L-arabinose transferase-like glycosyltransferase